ncbi:hypothetical protein H0H87_000537 [Tephrocybe sp. NHM501043]|nr:hypothetical protein H0H87_000537 [Tephrocybe sp. NHM501043]
MPQTSGFSMLDQLKDSIGLKNNACATQKDNAILPPLDLYGLETPVTAINNPMDKDASSLNILVTKKSNLVLRSPLFGPSSLKNDTHTIQAVFGSASLKNNPSTTQKEDAIFPPLNPDGLENLVTSTNDPMDKDASS